MGAGERGPALPHCLKGVGGTPMLQGGGGRRRDARRQRRRSACQTPRLRHDPPERPQGARSGVQRKPDIHPEV